MQAQPLQLVAGEAEPDGAGHGLLGLPAAAAVGTRRPGVERRTELLAGAEQLSSGSFLGDRQDGGDAGGALAVHVVQQQRRTTAQVERLERRFEGPARLARGPARDVVRIGVRDAGVERAAVSQGLQIGGALVEDGATQDDRERLRGRGHRRHLVAEQPAGEAVDGLAEQLEVADEGVTLSAAEFPQQRVQVRRAAGATSRGLSGGYRGSHHLLSLSAPSRGAEASGVAAADHACGRAHVPSGSSAGVITGSALRSAAAACRLLPAMSTSVRSWAASAASPATMPTRSCRACRPRA